ncbi:acyltransferase [Burkholderiaceae bacterium FT117]|uniref:acyltransferase family protein n=1 Tax=Zeimonas sediminis TaxID=2944268 RepID=UPI002342D54F|nr:acyltransferase [Zeimonas sediminis]MCM5570321.1 acyltransferase [Zeimonas sediminis]
MAASRLPLIDAMKALGCIAIVLHHLAVYGPMSDAVAGVAQPLFDWLYDRARLAVQVFLVLAGWLVAATLAPDGRPAVREPLSLAWKRYRRLAPPLAFAVAIAALVTALVRPWFGHDSLSAPPTLPQFAAHALLLQDVLGFEALSAGVWYVAMDFQLFVATALLAALAARLPGATAAAFPAAVALLAGASLFLFNGNPAYENYAVYFFGAYGLGMLAFWAARSRFRRLALAALVVLGAAALWQEFRKPIAVALATALLVAVADRRGWLASWPRCDALAWLGQRSYSIFVIHYGVLIAFNATWSLLFPDGVWINALGMLGATLASVAAGAALFRTVESRLALGLNRAAALLATMLAAALALEAA